MATVQHFFSLFSSIMGQNKKQYSVKHDKQNGAPENVLIYFPHTQDVHQYDVTSYKDAH